ncbi:SMC-Scp complex subunit ScpB [Hoeflea ulvae]|uniref:SMC-Scp complex subunit ScpB n=1 Tax=Hoeflea ulvae TaxID=2983764 RepID=A0ABT3YHK4_9HYPH|nr:SMC-Scp complex subunit ScpB [Hoeflea ulvae]MCY0095220.1 SMC-Scp complex subunit ScpB [Hoeflea ulvae]
MGSDALDALRERALHEAERIAEALIFASTDPVAENLIAGKLPDGAPVGVVMARLARFYADRGVNLVRVDNAWAFRTAADLGFLIRREETEIKKLSRAGLEVLSTIAYHQPVTRAEIEDVRGVATSKGTLDVLMETGWVRMRGRRRTPGRPVTYGTTAAFLDHFGLEDLRDLPGMDELKGAGLLSGRVPSNFHPPIPPANDDLTEEEDPITQMDLEELGLLTPMGEAED